MYICICKKVTDHQIRDLLVADGVITWKDLVTKTGCGTQCGKCIGEAKEVLAELGEEPRHFKN